MSSVGKLWGDQYPFERNHLQRQMTLAGLGTVFGVTAILLVHAEYAGVVGVSLILTGVIAALAAASRMRYVRETRIGFAILKTRGGLFVLGSALAVGVVGMLVVLLICLG